MKRILSILILILFCSNLYSIKISLKTFKLPKNAKIKIIGDVLSYNKKDQIFIAEGNVIAKYGDLNLTCEKLVYNKRQKLMIASGNVKIDKGDYSILGEKINFDLSKKIGTVEKGEIFIKDRHLHIRGDKIEKDENGNFKITKCVVTSCDRRVPFWSFTSDEAVVKSDGSAKAKKIKFNIKNYPLLYVPVGILPARKNRNTGFLVPKFGISGDYGFKYSQGFYSALNKSMDMTFYYELMSKRGIKTGLEYRYRLTENAIGWAKLFYLNDNGIEDEDYAIRDDKNNRLLFNIYHKQLTDNGFKIFADFYRVSDINYLIDFPKDFNEKDVDQFISRNNINSKFYISKNFYDLINISGESEWRKNIAQRKNNKTTQKIFDLNLWTTPTQFIGSKIYQDIKLRTVNYYRKNGDKSLKFLIYPDFTKSLFLNSSLKVTPVFAQYFYEINNNKNTKTRAYLKINYKIETDFSKAYDFYFFNFIRLNHVIEPEVEYNFISFNAEVPQLDEIDKERKRNTITYHLKNKLFAEDDEENFKKVIEWDIYQSVQLQKFSYLYNDNRFSNIFSEIKLKNWKNFAFKNDFSYNPYENYIETFNLYMNANILDKFMFSYDYRFKKRELEQMTFSSRVNFLDTMSAYFKINYDYFTDELNSVTYGFIYHPQCFTLDLNIVQVKNPDDIRFNFSFYLQGINLGLGKKD